MSKRWRAVVTQAELEKRSFQCVWIEPGNTQILKYSFGWGCLALGIAGQALADLPPNYFMYDVASVNGCFNHSEVTFTIAYGINELASQTVGQTENGCLGLPYPDRGFRRYFTGGNAMVGLETLDGSFSAAFAVADGGQIVGWAHDSVAGVDIPRPCLWGSGGSSVNLPTIGGDDEDEGVAYDMDNDLRLVGQTEDDFGNSHATYWASSTSVATDLGVLSGGTESLARGKNANNDIVGMAFNSSGDKVAILWESTGSGTWSMISLPTLDGDSYAHEINDSKVICGWSITTAPAERHAVKWEYNAAIPAWEITDLGTFSGGNKSEAFAINNAGDIVGQSRLSGSPGSEHGFLYSGSTMYDLNDKFCRYVVNTGTNWVLHEALDINNNGDIAGWGIRGSLANKPRPFVLNPIDCVADINGDGVTDISDLLLLLANWGPGCKPADINNSDEVDTLDLLMLFADWGCPDSE